MLHVCKILAMVIVGIALGLATTWATAIRGSMGADVKDGPWATNLSTGFSEGGPYLRARIAVHGFPIIAAPKNRGIVVFRTLVDEERRLADIDAARHNANCAPAKAG